MYSVILNIAAYTSISLFHMDPQKYTKVLYLEQKYTKVLYLQNLHLWY